LAGRIHDHHGNATADRERQAGGATDQFVGIVIVLECRFCEWADEHLQQARVRPLRLAFLRRCARGTIACGRVGVWILRHILGFCPGWINWKPRQAISIKNAAGREVASMMTPSCVVDELLDLPT